MLKTEKVLAANLKNLAYNILKNFNDNVIKNKTFSELVNCTECNKKIFARPNKVFTTLLCGHVYHRICIEKKLLLSKQLTCSTPKCEKSVEILKEFTTTETGLKRNSESSTSSLVGKMGKQLNIQSQEIINEEIPNIDNGENKDKVNSKGKGSDIVEGSIKKPIEVDSEKPNTMQDKFSNKKAKKKIKNEDSQMLKRLIKELSSNSNLQIFEINVEEGKNSENLLHLYNKIINVEIRKEIASQEVVKSYYSFEKVLSQRFKYHFDKFLNIHQAQMDVNNELEKQLPDTTKTTRNKRKERAQKIYFLFNSIGIEKIGLVKSFSMNAISKLYLHAKLFWGPEIAILRKKVEIVFHRRQNYFT
ncbi:hypothetical protein Glove_120g240 [Diversispora epigaea]|uniref:RING-type domain-containing protein n=1 Tax=Diversispora epigaea TaxID=1348612 RepID=A0A397IZM9_9GLOM|nr:hypothetical protein Glove_120g240 [Diversispora epigaea]